LANAKTRASNVIFTWTDDIWVTSHSTNARSIYLVCYIKYSKGAGCRVQTHFVHVGYGDNRGLPWPSLGKRAARILLYPFVMQWSHHAFQSISIIWLCGTQIFLHGLFFVFRVKTAKASSPE
jgi:hypothetical protein